MVLSNDPSIRAISSNDAVAQLKRPTLEKDDICPYMDGYLKYSESLSRVAPCDSGNLHYSGDIPMKVVSKHTSSQNR